MKASNARRGGCGADPPLTSPGASCCPESDLGLCDWETAQPPPPKPMIFVTQPLLTSVTLSQVAPQLLLTPPLQGALLPSSASVHRLQFLQWPRNPSLVLPAQASSSTPLSSETHSIAESWAAGMAGKHHACVSRAAQAPLTACRTQVSPGCVLTGLDYLS